MAPAIFDLRRKERPSALLLAGSILVIVASYTMVKVVRDAVFLAQFGAMELALLYILLAVNAGLLSAVGVRLARGVSVPRLIVVSHGIVAATLLVLWLALRHHVPATAWMLYLWSSFYGLFVIANFWLLGNHLYDARSAKRIFPLLGAGAIVGGVLGGQASILAGRVGAVNLLPIIAGGMMLAAVLAVMAWSRRVPRDDVASADPATVECATPERPRLGDAFRLVGEHRFLRLLAGLLFLATLTTTLVDLQLKSIVKEHFASDRDSMAVFFGSLTRVFSLVSLGVQLFITSRFLRRLGVGRALLVLPVAMALGAGAIAFHVFLAIPVVTAAALAKIGDGGLRFSLDKAAMELLYLPVSTSVKARAKATIDTVADRAATAATGVLWIALSLVAPADLRRQVILAAGLTAAIVAIWLIIVGRTRAAYVQSFRDALEVASRARSARDGAGNEPSLPNPELERLLGRLERRYPDRGILSAYKGLQGGEEVRASALELLDNLLDKRVKRELFALLEGEVRPGSRRRGELPS